MARVIKSITSQYYLARFHPHRKQESYQIGNLCQFEIIRELDGPSIPLVTEGGDFFVLEVVRKFRVTADVQTVLSLEELT